MSILSMRSEFLLPEKELIINKNMTIRQNTMLIASITEEKGIIKLWIFHHIPNSPYTNTRKEDFAECVTNRDNIVNRTLRTRIDYGVISEITIQGISLQFAQSSSSFISHNTLMYMKLQHFMEAGVDFSSIENINLDELILVEYQLAEEISFPEIDTIADMPISLKLREQLCEVLADPSHCFNLKVGKHDETRSFVDPSNGNEIKYHISEIVCHDIYTEMMKQFQDDEILKKLKGHGHDDTSIEKMKADVTNSLSQICPEDHVLLILMYECSEDIQLNFYTTEFLSAKPDHNVRALSFIHSGDEKGKYGNQIHSCLLKAVPIGFNDAVEVEFMSWYRKIPSETIDSRL